MQPSDLEYVIQHSLKTIPPASDVEIAFYGGSFTALPIDKQEQFLQIAAAYVKKIPQVSGVRCSTRPDEIDTERLCLLKKYYVNTIELGIQTMDVRVLKQSKRFYRNSQVYRAVDQILSFHFQLGLQIMPGLPGESLSSFQNTVQSISDLHPHFVRIYPTLVLKDTELEEQYREGHYLPLSLEDAIHRSAYAVIVFLSEGIQVLRLGLQSSENIQSNRAVIAGPFHPAFGELVYSRIFLYYLIYLIESFDIFSGLKITCSSRYISQIIGQRAQNKHFLKENYKIILSVHQHESESFEAHSDDFHIRFTYKEMVRQLHSNSIFLEKVGRLFLCN